MRMLKRSRIKADPAPDKAKAGQKLMAWVMPYLAEVTRMKAEMNSVVCPATIETVKTLITQKTMNGEIRMRAYFMALVSRPCPCKSFKLP